MKVMEVDMSTERILVIGLRMEQARSLREQFKDIFDIDFNPNATIVIWQN